MALSGLTRSPRFRPAQQLALDAFERDRLAGERATHLVAPPGSGKTVVGLELVRRLGDPALVLAPTVTIAAQWARTLDLFAEGPVEGFHVATYQSLCRTEDPGGRLRERALDALAHQRAALTLTPAAEVHAALAGRPTARDTRELAAEIARLKRAAAAEGDVSRLLDPAARERMAAFTEAGVRTVVLDECHHLASMWGYLVAALLDALGPEVHVIGLTATPPGDLGQEEHQLYARLLGPVDLEVPLPAVVRDGNLAPYQELAYFTEPLASERAWLGERHLRFAELLDRLHDPAPAQEEALSFPAWVIGRIRHRGQGEARVGFSTLAQRRPELARAGLRYLHTGGLELPEDAPRGEGWREPMSLEDWLVLLGDYAGACLRAHPGAAADRRLDELAVGLRDLGFSLTRTGVRRGGSDVDRVLTNSRAKTMALAHVLTHEADARGSSLRAVVLCDTEHPTRRPEGAALELAGGTRDVLRALGEDAATAVLRPIMVTGAAAACLPADALAFSIALGASVGQERDGVVELERPAWGSGDRVHAVGGLMAAGVCQVVVGTRGLLGEGWDAPVVNCLVDLTTVAADVSVRQMRGRGLRLDPGAPDKVTSNWDVVCVAPDLARGTADYERFVRRHRHLHAPCEDGSIETGVSHVHAALSPFVPPPVTDFPALNDQSRARAADPGAVRERWAVGTPYVGEDVPVLMVRGSSRGEHPTSSAGEELRPQRPARLPQAYGVRLAFSVGAARRTYPEVLPLDRLAGAVAEALAALGEVGAVAAESVVLLPRPGGVFRCLLADGGVAENATFAAALDSALGADQPSRWVVSRPCWPDGLENGAVRWRAMIGGAPLEERWHPVPAAMATHRERAEVFHLAWQRWLGPGRLLFAGRTEEGREARAASLSAASDHEASLRTVWR